MNIFLRFLTLGAMWLTLVSCGSSFVGVYNSGDHFYTTDLKERNNAIAEHGYIDDGVPIAGYIFKDEGLFSASSKRVELFRLYNSARGDHFYTTSAAERDKAKDENGYKNDGVPIAGYVYLTKVTGTVKFYRLYKPKNGDHFYTTDLAERQKAIEKDGYTYDGVEIAGYIFAKPRTGTVPLYRLYHP